MVKPYVVSSAVTMRPSATSTTAANRNITHTPRAPDSREFSFHNDNDDNKLVIVF